jgi:hypothetical protein
MHKFLNLYFTHGAGWRAIAEEEIRTAARALTQSKD